MIKSGGKLMQLSRTKRRLVVIKKSSKRRRKTKRKMLSFELN
jgi:hypothetical protein